MINIAPWFSFYSIPSLLRGRKKGGVICLEGTLALARSEMKIQEEARLWGKNLIPGEENLIPGLGNGWGKIRKGGGGG